MEWVPKSYQVLAVDHVMRNNEAGIFLDVGLGKTSITLTAIADLMYDSCEIRRVLVVAPKRVAEQVWSDEVEQWDHLDFLTVSVVKGTEKQRLRALAKRADIYTISRDNLRWLCDYYGERWPFDMVVLDELSGFRSSSSQRFRAIRRIRPFITRVVGLTATPAPNGLVGLWSQVYLLDQGERFGASIGKFRSKYFERKKGWVNGAERTVRYEPLPGAADEIYALIGDICISMSAKDWLDLPEPIPRMLRVRLPDEAYEAYRQLERDMLLPLDSADIIANTAAALSGKLLQLANGSIYDAEHQTHFVHDAKLDALEDLVEEANGNPVLVFYAYRQDLARLLERFPYGTHLQKTDDVYAWNRREIPVLFAHPQSAGHGLNLQAGGNIVVWYGVPWDLELYQQGNGRLARQGQTQQVIIQHIIARGTLDDDVMAKLLDKATNQNALLEAVKARIERVHSEAEIER